MKVAHKLKLYLLILFCFLVQNAFVYFDLPNPRVERLSTVEHQGLKIWRREGCMFCHQFYGQGGFMGPDLTNVASRVSLEDLSLRLDVGGYRMPSFKLKKEEKEQLYAYLRFMNSTGQGTLNTFESKSDLPWYEFRQEVTSQ